MSVARTAARPPAARRTHSQAETPLSEASSPPADSAEFSVGSPAVADALTSGDSVTVTVADGVAPALSRRVGERVGLARVAVREGSTLASVDPVGDGTAIEPSPPPHEVNNKAAKPNGTASLARRRVVTTVLDVMRALPSPAPYTLICLSMGCRGRMVQERDPSLPQVERWKDVAVIGRPYE